MKQTFRSWLWKLWTFASGTLRGKDAVFYDIRSVEFTLPENRAEWVLPANRSEFTLPENRSEWVMPPTVAAWDLPDNRPEWS